MYLLAGGEKCKRIICQPLAQTVCTHAISVKFGVREHDSGADTNAKGDSKLHREDLVEHKEANDRQRDLVDGAHHAIPGPQEAEGGSE